MVQLCFRDTGSLWQVLFPGLGHPAVSTPSGKRQSLSWLSLCMYTKQGDRKRSKVLSAIKNVYTYFFFFFFCFLPLHPRHMEVPRLGVEVELQLLAYTTATATSKPHLRPTLQLTAPPDP